MEIDDAVMRDFANRLRLDRHPEVGIYGGDFLRILRRFLHPRWHTVDVNVNWIVEDSREKNGFKDPFCTVWFATAGGRFREWTLPIGRNWIPYFPFQPKEWDEINQRWVDGQQLRGWRGALAHYVEHGFLRPHPQLDYIIGEYTQLLAHSEFHI